MRVFRKRSRRTSRIRPGRSGEDLSAGLLRVRDVTVSYNRIPAIHHVDFQLMRGQCAGLLGPNGAGKTTLLKAICGLLPLETGEICFDNFRLGKLRTGKKGIIAYVPQRESVDWDFPITVRGLVEMGRYAGLGAWGKFGSNDEAIVDEALALVELTDFADRQIKKLSGGQQQRAFLARAWAQQSEIYLLDEPFTGLDAPAKEAFHQALNRMRDEGKILLVSHHDLKEVPELFDQVVLLNGELVVAGATAEVFTQENLEKAYSVGVFSGHGH